MMNLSNYGGCDDIGAAEPEYDGYQGKGYEAGDDCAEVSFLSGATFPRPGQKIAGYSGYCFAKVQDGNFCEWVLLARA